MKDLVTILCLELMEENLIQAEEDPAMLSLSEQRDQLTNKVLSLLRPNEKAGEELSNMESSCQSLYGQLMFREGMSIGLRLFLELF